MPPITLYINYLNAASKKFNLTLDECRSRYGLYTERQWIELLNANHKAILPFIK